MNKEIFFSVVGNDDLWYEIKKHTYPNKQTCNFYSYMNGDMAAYHGYVGLMREKQLVYTDEAMGHAASNGHLEAVRYLCETGQKCSTSLSELTKASSNGHLEVVKYLCDFYKERNIWVGMRAINAAALNGHLKILEYLYKIGESCSGVTMDIAAKNGYLDMVKYLNEVVLVGCSTNAVDMAAINGHFAVVIYLCEAGKEHTLMGIHGSRDKGHVEITNYLEMRHDLFLDKHFLVEDGQYIPIDPEDW